MAVKDNQPELAVGAELPLEGPGDRLRLARERAGLTLEQVAAETRIPQRHLGLIDAGLFGELPGRTYAVGFSRNYAKAVGLDENEIVAAVREEIGARDYSAQSRAATFEPGDPARIPSRGLAWFGLFAAVLLVAGLFVFYRSVIAPGSGPGSILTDEEAQMAAQADGSDLANQVREPVPDPQGPVVFTALRDDVWVKFYDGTGERLLEKQMALGETYTVPSEAVSPQIWTGWPAALEITVGGRKVPKLSETDRIMKDVEVSPEALLARADPPVDPSSNAIPESTAEPVGGQ